ncbi:MAG: hypothetical protein WBD57_09755 [Candidatus Cybelea sp.]
MTFWLRDSDDALRTVAKQLSSLGAPMGSEMQYSRGDEAFVMPFGSTECVAVFLDGASLPREVYRSEDVNEVVARLIQRSGTKAQRRAPASLRPSWLPHPLHKRKALSPSVRASVSGTFLAGDNYLGRLTTTILAG